MKRNLFVIIIFVIILAGVVWFQFLNRTKRNQNSQAPILSESADSILELEPQTNSEGAVTISIVPRKSAGVGILEFKMTFDTHSVELDYNLTKVATLVADGKEYQPIAWDGDPSGGHHRSGILQFAPISPEPKSIMLKIRNVGDVEKRNFIWQLK